MPLLLPVLLLLQAMHVPPHTALQQKPSVQKPLWHCAAAVQAVPLAASQAPLPLHSVAHSLSGSVLTSTLPHVPLGDVLLALLHAWQTALHAALQQKPSVQKPLWHCAAAVQAVPLAASQAPLPLHSVAHSLSGSVLTSTLPHVPLGDVLLALLQA